MRICIWALALLCFVLAAQASPTVLDGRVLAAGSPWENARVTLYAGFESVEVLGEADTDDDGNFSIEYCDVPSNAVLYVEVLPGSGSTDGRLMAIVGNYGHLAGSIFGEEPVHVVNELTTIACIFSMQQFMDDDNQLSGNEPGLQNAAFTAFNIADPVTGLAGNVIATEPNNRNSTFRLWALGNALSACTGGTNNGCSNLLDAARVNGQPNPDDSNQALLQIARFPKSNIDEIFDLTLTGPLPYLSLLSGPPDGTGWMFIILFKDRGFNAPGRPAVDVFGNTWWANNFDAPRALPGEQPITTAAEQLPLLGPDGQSTLGGPLRGGGLSGPGYGVAFSTDGTMWVGNYAGSTITRFSATGELLSPGNGFTNGNICHPQGMMADNDGNIWIVNNSGSTNANSTPCDFVSDSSVALYPDGDPSRAVNLVTDINDPFDVAIDAEGRAWVTDAGFAGGRVVVLTYDDDDAEINIEFVVENFVGDIVSDPLKTALQDFIESLGFASPKTIAIDSEGFAWVANFESADVTIIDSDGDVTSDSPINVPGMLGGWGLAVDGLDRIWVADFTASNVFLLCGNNPDGCLPGQSRGDEVLEGGISSELFEHFTGIQIDETGNLWAANNIQSGVTVDGQDGTTFAGGDGVIQIVGLAIPVRAPLLGPPQEPRETSFDGDRVFTCDDDDDATVSPGTESDVSDSGAAGLTIAISALVTAMVALV